MKKLFIIIFLSCLFACQKKYTLEIHSMDWNGMRTSDTRTITAKNDSLAFIEATKDYWIHKSAMTRIFKEMEDSTIGIPFYFSVHDENDLPISFDSVTTEKLTSAIVRYFKDSVMPSLDTITPYSKRSKEPTANIY